MRLGSGLLCVVVALPILSTRAEPVKGACFERGTFFDGMASAGYKCRRWLDPGGKRLRSLDPRPFYCSDKKGNYTYASPKKNGDLLCLGYGWVEPYNGSPP